MDPIAEIKVAFKKFDSSFVVGSILDLGSYYVVYLTKQNLPKDQFILDNQYKYDKKTKKISGFAVADDREKYREALKHPVYILGKTK